MLDAQRRSLKEAGPSVCTKRSRITRLSFPKPAYAFAQIAGRCECLEYLKRFSEFRQLDQSGPDAHERCYNNNCFIGVKIVSVRSNEGVDKRRVDKKYVRQIENRHQPDLKLFDPTKFDLQKMLLAQIEIIEKCQNMHIGHDVKCTAPDRSCLCQIHVCRAKRGLSRFTSNIDRTMQACAV